jgi:hypothetical protein
MSQELAVLSDIATVSNPSSPISNEKSSRNIPTTPKHRQISPTQQRSPVNNINTNGIINNNIKNGAQKTAQKNLFSEPPPHHHHHPNAHFNNNKENQHLVNMLNPEKYELALRDRYKGPNIYDKWRDPRVVSVLLVFLILFFTFISFCILTFSNIIYKGDDGSGLSISQGGWALNAAIIQCGLFAFLFVIHLGDMIHFQKYYPLRSVRYFSQLPQKKIKFFAISYFLIILIVLLNLLFWTLGQEELNKSSIYIGINAASWAQVFNTMAGFSTVGYIITLSMSAVFTWNSTKYPNKTEQNEL